MEITKQITNSKTLAVFTNPLIYPTVKKSVEDNPQIKLPIIVVNDGSGPIPSGTINFNDLVKEDIEEFSKYQKTNVDPEDDILLLYSSGTTGLPKGVQLTHRIGAKLVCLPQFSVENYIKILENYKPTLLYLVPPIIQMMIINEQIKSRHVEHVRIMLSGAAPLGTDTINKLFERISDKVQLLQGYGMTETSPIITLSQNAPCNSVGFVVPNTQLRIVQEKDDKNINVGANEIGEIYVKGPQVMKGYYQNPQATQDTMDGDWMKTGDLGKRDESGHIYIEGRSKELIKVKGFQVAPAELENIIRGIENIVDVAVIGVPHEKYGEIPKAFIVPKKGVTIKPEDVKNFVAKRVSNYKQIGYVQYIDEIPKSQSGKILRKELQNM
ncbi:hypothetical protein M0802_014744 [Mischocyttarus mexicanus]|nr:hypothetical protein M0802_014744 [Mischocyttarus mexicanus]